MSVIVLFAIFSLMTDYMISSVMLPKPVSALYLLTEQLALWLRQSYVSPVQGDCFGYSPSWFVIGSRYRRLPSGQIRVWPLSLGVFTSLIKVGFVGCTSCIEVDLDMMRSDMSGRGV